MPESRINSTNLTKEIICYADIKVVELINEMNYEKNNFDYMLTLQQ